MASILFVQWDGGGTVPPAMAVALRLRDQGHRVRWLASRSLAARLAGAGLAYEPFVRTPDFDPTRPDTDGLRDWEARTRLGAMQRLFAHVVCGPAAAQADDVRTSLAATPTDVVVSDAMMTGVLVGAEAAGVPCAGLVYTLGTVPLPGIPPPGLGLAPLGGRLGRWRDGLLRGFGYWLLRRWLGTLNQTRRAHHLDPVPTIEAQWLRVARLIILSSRAFDFPVAWLPDNVRYVGPAFWEEPGGEDVDLPAADERPLVVASLSTTYQASEALLRTIVAALGSLPVRGLVTTGAGYTPGALGPLPANVAVRAYVPHAHVLPRAAAVVTHAGHGTVIKALAHGVPLVCVPLGRDQPDVARRAVATGAALSLPPQRLTPRRLAAALAAILGEPRYRAAAGRMAATLAEEDGPRAAAAEILALAGSHR